MSDGIYEDQDDIIFTVEFSENVLVSGSPVLTLDIGGVTRQAALLSSSLNQAVFSYTVEQPDNDNNGIEIVSLDNGVITDAALNLLDRTLPVVDTSNVFVSTDIIAPTILSITAVDGNYKAGDNLNFTATFSEPVVITGTPYLLVDIGGTQVQANMTSNNSADATFSYTVLAGQLDTDGVQVLSLDSAVITDNALNLLDRTLPSMDMSLVKVDAVAPSIVNIILPSNGYYGWYTLDEQLIFVEGNIQLNFSVQFDEVVFVSGVPRLRIKIGENASDITVREALYQNGHGTDTLLFTYTILEPELDLDGIVLIGFTAGYGSIYDAAFNLANLEFNPLDYNTSGILVDSVIPIINSITPPSTGYYNSGDQLDFIVNYNDNVIVNTSLGTPYMTLTILDFYDSVGTPVQVSYVSGSGSSQLLFRYTVPNTNYILASISLSSPINLNGGTIRDVASNHASLNFPGLIPSTANIFIDTISPTITNIDAPTNGTYGVGQHLLCRFFFSEWVVVTGTPTVNVVIGSSTKTFQYLNGSNSNALDFRYTVVSGDNDADGIVLDSSILLPGGATIRDLAGNNATLTFTPLSTPNVRIDTTAPVINSVTPPSAGQYGVGQQLNFTFNFSEIVNVTGTPSFTITIGTTNVSATYVSGSGSSQLLFRYTVLAGQNDSNGIAVSSPIVLNGGTIRDSALNNATLTFTPPTTTGVIVDTTATTITSMSAPADDNYATGEVISFVANFSENVVVTGTPFLQVTIGSSAKQFDYVSGSGTNALTFSYTVLSGDLDDNGISFASTSIQAPSATIRDSANNNAVLSFTAPTTTGILVNASLIIKTVPVTGTVNDFVINPSDGSINIQYQNNTRFQRSVNGGNTFYAAPSSGFANSYSTDPLGMSTPDGAMYINVTTGTSPGVYRSDDSGLSFTRVDTTSLFFLGYDVSTNLFIGLINSTSGQYANQIMGYVWQGGSITTANRYPLYAGNLSNTQTALGTAANATYFNNMYIQNSVFFAGVNPYTTSGTSQSRLVRSTLNIGSGPGGFWFDGVQQRYIMEFVTDTNLPVLQVEAKQGSTIAHAISVIETGNTSTYIYNPNTTTNLAGASTSLWTAYPFTTIFNSTDQVKDIAVGDSNLYILTQNALDERILRKKSNTLPLDGAFTLVNLPTDIHFIEYYQGKLYIINKTGNTLYILNDE